MKVEDLTEIIKGELRGTNMYEYLGDSVDRGWMAYKNFQLKSFKKRGGKWHVTASLLKEVSLITPPLVWFSMMRLVK